MRIKDNNGQANFVKDNGTINSIQNDGFNGGVMIVIEQLIIYVNESPFKKILYM